MLAGIFLDILLPILLMVALGAWLRWKFAVDMQTLTRLNIYLFMPAFVFERVAGSTLPWSDMGGVVAVTVIHVAILGFLVFAIGKALGVNRKTLAAVALAVMFYNSGNFGLPLAELAYPSAPKDGGAVQAFVVLVQNVLTFTLGLGIAAMAHHVSFRQVCVRILRMPVLYVLAAALGARLWLDADTARALPALISKPVGYLAGGLVPIALVTLGAQLAVRPRWPAWKPVSAVLFVRLIYSPVQMLAMLWIFHAAGFRALDLWAWPAELLILTAAVPTAVNTLLLTMELEGDAVLAADCVFWSTVFSCLTIAGWLVVLHMMFGG